MATQSDAAGASRSECRRCGTCCEKGGPVFHGPDRALIEKGAIAVRHLFTIRRGEPVHDSVRGRIRPATTEMIKIKGVGNRWVCCFFDSRRKRCRIYAHRPLECRLLKCWDTRDIEAIYGADCLSRADLLSDVEGLWPLIADHEQRCGYGRLRALIDADAGRCTEGFTEALVHMIAYDRHLRLLVVEKAGMKPEMTDFLFGRPLQTTAGGFGLRIVQKGAKTIVTAVPGGAR